MSQPEIWVSISIRGGHDGADQPQEKVLDLRITSAATGDTEVMSAVPGAALAPPRGQLPVVNIVIGSESNGAVLAGHRGNGGCAGSFGGHRATQSATRARAHGTAAGSGTSPVPPLVSGKDGDRSVFGGGSGGAGGDGVAIDGNPAEDNPTGGSTRGHGGLRGKGWTGTGGRGGQSGAVSPVGYQSIAFAGFVGANHSGGAGPEDDAPGGVANGAEADSDETGSMGAIGEDDRRHDDAVTVPVNDDPAPAIADHWGSGLSGGSHDPYATNGTRRPTNGYQGPED